MKIEAFLLCWNESELMPLVVKHYQKFCDKITILDNHSTDGSRELALSLGCEVKTFGDHTFNDQNNLEIKNQCWKGSQADWVIVADFDECLHCEYDDYTNYPDNIRRYDVYDLKEWIEYIEPRATIIKTIGWQIMSNEMPKDDLLEITNGYRFDNYSKFVIFNPKAIKEINFNPGGHRINPVGDVRYSDESLYLLHYKHIGGVERTIRRYQEYQPRMSRMNRKKGWGIHYDRSIPSLHEEWNERMAKSKNLI